MHNGSTEHSTNLFLTNTYFPRKKQITQKKILKRISQNDRVSRVKLAVCSTLVWWKTKKKTFLLLFRWFRSTVHTNYSQRRFGNECYVQKIRRTIFSRVVLCCLFPHYFEYATALRYRHTNETTNPSDRSEKIKTIAQESDESIERNGNERVRECSLRSRTADSTRCARTIHKFKCERVRLHAVVVRGTKKFVCSIAAHKKTKQKSIVKRDGSEMERMKRRKPTTFQKEKSEPIIFHCLCVEWYISVSVISWANGWSWCSRLSFDWAEIESRKWRRRRQQWR